jgi:hypothetical protein
MATVLEGYTTEDQSYGVHFLLAKGLKAKDINREMFPIYGGKCLSRKAVHNWVVIFFQGISTDADDARQDAEVAEITVKRLLC